MKNLYLHIGLPKTGSTYIQQWLMLNRATLAARKMWVPSRHIFAHRLAAECITDARRANRSDVIHIKEVSFEAARNDLAAAIGNAHFTSGILSSEYFCECPPQEVASLREMTGETRICIVLFLRRQDRLLESGYNQEVKAMGAKYTLGPPRYSKKADWLELYESWASVFGHDNLRVINYDVVAKSGDMLPAFLDAVGLSRELMQVTRLEIEDGQNRSLPANLLQFKRLANAMGELGLSQWLYRAVDAGMPGTAFRLPPDVARQHLALYEKSNRELAHRLGMTDATELFPQSDLEGTPAGADLSNRLPIETLAQLLAFEVREAEDREAALTQRIKALEQKLDALAAQIDKLGGGSQH